MRLVKGFKEKTEGLEALKNIYFSFFRIGEEIEKF